MPRTTPGTALNAQQMQSLYASAPLPAALPVKLSELERLQASIRMRKARESKKEGLPAVLDLLAGARTYAAEDPLAGLRLLGSRPAASFGAVALAAPQARRPLALTAPPSSSMPAARLQQPAALLSDTATGHAEEARMPGTSVVSVPTTSASGSRDPCPAPPPEAAAFTAASEQQLLSLSCQPVAPHTGGFLAADAPLRPTSAATTAVTRFPGAAVARPSSSQDIGDHSHGQAAVDGPSLLQDMCSMSAAMDQRGAAVRPSVAVETFMAETACGEDEVAGSREPQAKGFGPSSATAKPKRGRPAAAVKVGNTRRTLCRGKPAARTQAAPDVCRRPAAATLKKRPAAASSSTAVCSATATSGNARVDLCRKVPRDLRVKYKNGCSTCRYTPGCCPSCWRKRGYEATSTERM